MSESLLIVDNPYTGEVVLERQLATSSQMDEIMKRSHEAHRSWKRTSLTERLEVVKRFTDHFHSNAHDYAAEITASMGKPLGQARGEVRGMIYRATQMSAIAEDALADIVLPEQKGYSRWIRREPVGVVVVLAAWNYPLLTAINSVVAAVLAGNSVVLKQSPRAPRCAEQFAEAFEAAGAPKDLVTAIHCSYAVSEELVAHPLAGYVSFTGSVFGGRRIYQAVANSRFIDVGLELGGKDPAYVAEDANFEHAVVNLVEGGFYNAGQSCCGIERVYVHETIYDKFLEATVEETRNYQPGDPMVKDTSLGPMAQPTSVPFLEKQIDEAKSSGARILTGGSATQFDGKGRFFSPTIVADTDHSMSIAKEESFGPVIAIQKVSSDQQAIEKMNDSAFGLTASIWTSDIERGRKLLPQLEAGTVFLNRADYLDPHLAWTGVKDSGKGASLSALGFHAVTRPKSYHLRLKV